MTTDFNIWLAQIDDNKDDEIRFKAMKSGRTYIEQAEHEFNKKKGLGRFL